MLAPPNVSPFDPANTRFDGYNITPGGEAIGQGANLRPVDGNIANLAYLLAKDRNPTTRHRIQPSGYVELTPLEGLTLRSQLAADLAASQGVQASNPLHGTGRALNGLIQQSWEDYTLWNWQSSLNYALPLGDAHRLSVALGYEAQQTTQKAYLNFATGFVNPFFLQADGPVRGGFLNPLTSANGVAVSVIGFDSYFGRVSYSFDDRYYVQASVRNDGLSILEPATRRGWFGGGSLGWRVSREAFFQPLNTALGDAVSELKLRASFAQVGNANISNTRYFFDVSGAPALTTFRPTNYGSQSAIILANIGNPALGWEQSLKYDAGIDLGLWNGRLALTADYFLNDVNRLVQAVQIPPAFGTPLGSTLLRNFGSLRSQGLELALTGRILDGARLQGEEGFVWESALNFTTLDNRITALPADNFYQYNIDCVGEQVGSIFGFRWQGVNAANGNPMWLRADGSTVQYDVASGRYARFNESNPTDVSQASALTAADRQILGTGSPTWYGGWTNTFRYAGFDLEIFLRFQGGNSIMNVVRQSQLLNQNFQNNGVEILQRWTTPGQQTNVPRLWAGRGTPINNIGAADSRFVERGDFLRLQNVVLGYTFTKAVLESIGLTSIRSVRLFAQAQNLWFLTSYTGLDPDFLDPYSIRTLTPNSQIGVDSFGIPQQPILSFGLSVGL